MAEFKKGQRVRVEFEGVIVDIHSHDTCAKIVDSGAKGVGWYHYVYLNSPAVKVTLAAPESWPPQVGDIWEAEGREYYVYQHHNPERPGVRSFVNPDIYWYAEGLEGFKGFNPTLVRRRGQ